MTTVCKPVSKPLQPVRRRSSKKDKRDPRLVKYQTEWTKICDKWGFSASGKERRDLRHSILCDLFGSKFEIAACASNWKWDCIFLAQDFLLANGILWWSPETAKCAIEEGLCKRYIWNVEHAGHDIKGIKKIGAPEAYVGAVAADKFGVKNWRALDSQKLFYLFITIKNRVRKAFNEGRSLYDESNLQPAEESGYVEADDDDFPF